MRLRLTARVEGAPVAQQTFHIDANGYRIGFNTDKRRRVTEIWAECRIDEFRDYMPALVPGDGTVKRPHQISMPTPPQADELRSVLQYIESLGSFWLGIRRIAWSEAEVRWAPDSDAERRELKVFSISNRLEYPETPIPFRADRLERLLANREGLDYLVIPMSFYREGVGDYRTHRYVNAFYNFYFFLEDLYGRGKTKNQHVLEAFRSSPQLTSAILETHELLNDPAMARNKAELSQLVRVLRCDYSLEGLLEFLVMVRGELHHFSQRSSRPKGHPLNQLEWRSVAFFGMSICISLIRELANGTKPDSM